MRKHSDKSSLFMRLFLAAVVLLPVCTAAYAQDARNFWVYNQTGRRIIELNVSPHELDDWGDNVLANGQTLGVRKSTAVYFEDVGDTSCWMDFRIVFGDGSEQTYEEGTNVCEISSVTFYRNTLRAK